MSTNAPTSQARSIALALVTAFERSVQNNRKLQECVARDRAGQIGPEGWRRVSRASSEAASAAKDAFRTRYNALRRSLELPTNHPSF